jgi:hypothetical protein
VEVLPLVSKKSAQNAVGENISTEILETAVF